MIRAIPSKNSADSKQGKLLFNRIGDEYFLSQAGNWAAKPTAISFSAIAPRNWRRITPRSKSKPLSQSRLTKRQPQDKRVGARRGGALLSL